MLKRLFASRREAPLAALYAAVVAAARQPEWYRDGGVPDTFDGRFDMLAALLARTLDRLAPGDAALLMERFVADMDGQLRERGIGDLIVGKHVGRMVAALGGRMSAYRDAIGDEAALGEALARNLWRGAPPAADKVALTAKRLQAFDRRLAALAPGDLIEGRLG